jgi:hypothetical protein
MLFIFPKISLYVHPSKLFSAYLNILAWKKAEESGVPGNTYWRGKLGTFDLLVLTSLDHLPLDTANIIFYNTNYLNEEVNRTEPIPLS